MNKEQDKKMKSYGKIKRIVLSCMVFFIAIFYWNIESSIVQASNMDMRAVWISYLDYGNLKDKSHEEFKNNVNAMYDQVISRNLNTVIVQVRPFDDAIYPSSYYKWCNYITSNPGGPGYNPLSIMIELAHNKGLRFEAWINPYRIDFNNSYDPGDPSVRNRIVDGIDEIVRNYNVDGIHFDDYFYRSDNSTPVEQKKANVNELIRNVYARIKAIKPSVTFGISPQGNIENCRNMGADIDTWLSSNGYIDYIMPQLYWTDNWGAGGGTSMYSNRLSEWKSLVRNNTTLYVGLALYKVVDKPAADIGWSLSSSNLLEQVQKASSAGIKGYSLFRYNFLNYEATQAELNNLASYTPPVDTTQIASFVTSMYRNILNREPDAEGLNNWVNSLANKRLNGADLAETFVFGAEFNQRKLNNSEFVEMLYKAFAGRSSDNSGKQYWVKALNQGVSRRGVCASFIASTEFINICTNSGITPGNIVITEPRDVNANITMFVYRCYENILGRSADIEGLNYHTNNLLKNNSVAASLVENFFASKEFVNMNYSHRKYIEIIYKTCMNRDADKEGLDYWLSALNQGVDRKGVLFGFIESNEFTNLCGAYGINKGSLTSVEPRNLNANLTMFISRCYEKALGRKAEIAGLNYYTQEIMLKRITPIQAAQNFVLSNEFKNKNLSDTNYIKVLYRLFLDREYDQTGLDYHMGRMKNGMSRENILFGFAYASEFKKIMNSFGL